MFSYISFLVTPVLLLLITFVKRRINSAGIRMAGLIILVSTFAALLLIPVLQQGTGSGVTHARVTGESNVAPGMWLTADGPLANALRTAAMFIWRGDRIARHNIPGAAQIPRWLSPLLLIGVIRELRSRSARSYAILAWWVAGLLPTIFSKYCPHAGRSLGAAVPTAVLIARGGLSVISAVRYRRFATLRALHSRYTPAVVAALLITHCAWQYFYAYGRSYEVWEQFQSASVEAAHYLQRLPKGTVVLREPFENGFYSFDVLSRVAELNVRPVTSANDLKHLAPAPPQPFYYTVVGRDRFGAEFLKLYPGARQEHVLTDPAGRPVGVIFSGR
jgi:hypothetical protein